MKEIIEAIKQLSLTGLGIVLFMLLVYSLSLLLHFSDRIITRRKLNRMGRK